MVKLNWENKKDMNKNLETNITKYKNKFQEISFLIENKKSNIKKEINHTEWKNKLFWGENIEVLYYLLNFYENKIDLVYLDPPFFSGMDYHIHIKEQDKIYEDIAYHDRWNKDLDSYLQMLYERLILIRKLLSSKGLLFIHLDWHASHYIKIILDEIFGTNNFINSIVWYYYNKYSAGKKHLPRAHDDILIYSKTKQYTFNEIRIPREKPTKQLKRINVDGILKNFKDENGKVVYRIVKDKKLDDVWKIPCLQPASKHWVGYPNQKHHRLLERIIELGSNEGDLIIDLFCGSGTTLYAADKLKRRWIGVDISKYAIYLTRRRILNYYSKINLNHKHYFNIYADSDQDKKDVISSNFFNKNLHIKQKK